MAFHKKSIFLIHPEQWGWDHGWEGKSGAGNAEFSIKGPWIREIRGICLHVDDPDTMGKNYLGMFPNL